ncbi:MAG: Uma2 family endonuclease [Verrucomicrobia bacterium]|nr:Uma2 family endonuclease [Verrucomicrobiota bacterium]
MTAVKKPLLTPEEYLTIERAAPFKSEFVNGEMYAMAGGSLLHALITNNVSGSLWSRLRGGRCRAYSNDLRVHVPDTGLYTYPDVSVVCGEPQLVSDQKDNLTNPTLLVEVLSPSTEKYDRGGKFLHYQRIASLRDFLLVSQDQARVEHYARQPSQLNQWLLTVVTGLESTLALPSLGIELPLTEIYDGVELPAVPPPPPLPEPGEDRPGSIYPPA